PGKVLIKIGPILSGVCRFYNACIIANVHNASSRLRERDRSLIWVEATRRIGIAPIMTYLSPGDAFVVGSIESLVAGHDVLWIDSRHSESSGGDMMGGG